MTASSGVEPEEVQAILELFGARGPQRSTAEVAERDFRRPRRLSPARLEELQRELSARTSEVESALAAVFGRPQQVALVGLSEVSAAELLAAGTSDLTLGELEVGGRPGWIQWPATAAVSAIESILGSAPGNGTPRPLSRVEERILVRILDATAGVVGRALGLVPGPVRVLPSPAEASDWRASGENADDHRLSVHLELRGHAGASLFQVHLPGVSGAGAQDERDAAPERLPAHLEPVPVELSARLGASDVSLSELLALEPGDVIPLGIPAETPLTLLVEGHACGSASLGVRAGKLALRVQIVRPPVEPD